nr:MAG TPA: hypothetical protein [Caudoviricetes sp.]
MYAFQANLSCTHRLHITSGNNNIQLKLIKTYLKSKKLQCILDN